MNLATLLGLNLAEVTVILVGKPEETNILDSNDEPYYVAKLKSPVKVRCSVDPLIDALETDEVYVRKADILAEGWKFVTEGKPEEGFFREGWVADFSKSHQVALYQSESIRKWSRTTRSDRRDQDRAKINAGIREKMAAKGK